ncbi:MAG: RsmD family RNA methyltransferase, partial [Patescibacteria group bacterium]
MNTYFSTFITGLGDVVIPALEKRLSKFNLKLLLDGLVIYGTKSSDKEIKYTRFLNNSFFLLKLFDNLKECSFEKMAEWILREHSLNKPPLSPKSSTFRIVFSRENQIVSVNPRLQEKLENYFSKLFKLQIDRANPDVEIWFLWRNEGYGFIGVRLTHKPNYEKVLNKGELRPELAHLLCLISQPDKDDVFLDPFASFGAIPFERAISFPYTKIIASDRDKQIFQKLQKRAGDLGLRIILGRYDALNLSSLTNESVTKIVTDPPWGFYKEEKNTEEFYTKMLEEFVRVLKPDGLIVILTGQKELLEKLFEKFSNLKL